MVCCLHLLAFVCCTLSFSTFFVAGWLSSICCCRLFVAVVYLLLVQGSIHCYGVELKMKMISRIMSTKRCSTNKYFQILGNIHDIESFLHVSNILSLNQHIFLCHWGHLAIIFTWISSSLFSIGLQGNLLLMVFGIHISLISTHYLP